MMLIPFLSVLLLSLLSNNRVVANYYYTTTDLGQSNFDVTEENPLRGYLTNPDWSTPPYLDTLPSTLEFYYVGLNEVMEGLDSFTGIDTYLEPRIASSASRNKHVILRFIMDYPGQASMVPQFLIDGGLQFNTYTAYGGGQSPDYSDTNLLNALDAFIAEIGNRYDGDPRIGFIQVGLLGFWGEWHTYTTQDEGWIPSSTEEFVIEKFDAAFDTTQIQLRYPHYHAIGRNKFGLHDDSFAHSTLDGVYNGGVTQSWFFWPKVLSANYDDFWKTGAMGGEIRPEIQENIFSNTYPGGTEYHQEFIPCSEITHATYMLNYHAFASGYTNEELDNAKAGLVRMGYNFQVTEVAASVGTIPNTVDITARIKQVGVAPFYYNLALNLVCNGGTFSESVSGIETIVAEGSSGDFVISGVPSTTDCLDEVTLTLSSPYLLPGTSINFAQGSTGTVTLSIPLPTAGPVTPQPSPPPTLPPTLAPVSPSPTPAPTPLDCSVLDKVACQSNPSCAWQGGNVKRCSGATPTPPPAPTTSMGMGMLRKFRRHLKM